MMNLNWRELTATDVSPDPLLAPLINATEPVALSTLALTLAKTQLRRHGVIGINPAPSTPILDLVETEVEERSSALLCRTLDPHLRCSVTQAIQADKRLVSFVGDDA